MYYIIFNTCVCSYQEEKYTEQWLAKLCNLEPLVDIVRYFNYR